MKADAALKLAYTERLDPRTHDPERVKEEILAALERGDFTRKDIARFTTMSDSVISQVLNNNYQGDVQGVEKSLVLFWKNWVSRHSIVQTETVKVIQNFMDWVWARRLIGMVVGDNGSGKSKAAQHYCATHPDDTAYIAVDQDTLVLEALNAIAKQMNIEDQMSGPASFRRETIIRALKRKSGNRLVVIDIESDDVRSKVFSTIRTIYGDNEKGYCGIIFIGTQRFVDMLKDPRRNLRFMQRRINLRLDVRLMQQKDAFDLIDSYPHSLESAEKKKIYAWATEKIRFTISSLHDLMEAARDRAQDADKAEIDYDCIEEAMRYVP